MIVYLHPHFEYPGGATRFVLQSASALVEAGHDVAIVASGRHRWPESTNPNLNFFWVDVPLSSSLAYWLLWPFWYYRVKRLLDRLPVTVLFPQVFPANLWGFVYRRQRQGMRCVWYCHEPSAFIHDPKVIRGISGYKRYLAMALRPLLVRLDVQVARSADSIIANSLFTASRATEVYGRCDAVVYPGVDLGTFAPVARKQPYFVSVARLTKFKRIDLVLEAIAILRQRHGLKVEYWVIGDGEERSSLEASVTRLDLSESVRFLGRLNDADLARVVASAQAVVVAATDEPFGLVPIEAMAAGTAVIASDSGGPRETVIEGKTGLLFDAGDAESLARRLKEFIFDFDANRMGADARSYVKDRFAWSSAAAALEQVFAPPLGNVGQPDGSQSRLNNDVGNLVGDTR